MNAFAGLDAAQAELLEQLRDPNAGHRQVLVQLVSSNCLLELAKLTNPKYDLGSFARAFVDTFMQFVPLDQCALVLKPHGLPPVRAVSGEIDDDVVEAMLANPAVRPRSAPVNADCMRVIADERLMGSLLHGALPDALIESTFTKRLHEQLAQSLLIVLEAERVRRQAAADRALALISALSNTYTEDNLVEVASVFSALPNACGCHLVMENQRFSGPVRVVAGSMDGFGDHWRHRYTLDNRVGLTIEISWATETTTESVTHLEEICDTLREALDRIEQNVRLQEEVETDALTGVGNRRRAVRMLAAARSQAERRGESTAVMMMDLDHFKKVNDMLGHDAGDRVLTLFGHMLSDTVRGYDTVARWGGEEFVIICPETDNAGAAALAHRILENTPKACAPALPDEWMQTVSIGIATYPAVADTPDALLREADRALYTAKSLGRNRFIPAPVETLVRRMSLPPERNAGRDGGASRVVGVDAELIADAESDLSAVEAALARLDEGTYGLCDVCGGRIDDSVLADDPVALRCRDRGEGAPAPDPGWTSAATPAEE